MSNEHPCVPDSLTYTPRQPHGGPVNPRLSLALMCLLIPSILGASEKSTPWVSDQPNTITLTAPPNEQGTDVNEDELFDESKAILFRSHASDQVLLR
jgi:hypothetical protein